MFEKNITCPICGKGKMTEIQKTESFNYRGYMLVVPNLPMFVCNYCGKEFVHAQNMMIYDNLFNNFFKNVDELLDGEDIVHYFCPVTQQNTCPWKFISYKKCGDCQIPPCRCNFCGGLANKHHLNCPSWNLLKERIENQNKVKELKINVIG